MPLIRKDAQPAAAAAEPLADPVIGLASDDAEKRWAAARAIPINGQTRDQVSAALSREANPRVREALFTTLARAGGTDGVAIALPLLKSDDAGLRTGAMDVLVALPQHLLPHLDALLADPDFDVRILACELVRSQPPVEAIRLLSDVLARDPVANVCAAAIGVLADLGDSAVAPLLQECARRFPDDPFLGFSVKVATQRIASQAS